MKYEQKDLNAAILKQFSVKPKKGENSELQSHTLSSNACCMWCIVSPFFEQAITTAAAIAATKAAAISRAMGHLWEHLKAPSLSKLCLKKIIKWIKPPYFINAHVSTKTAPVMVALRASKIVELWYFKIYIFYYRAKTTEAGSHRNPQRCYEVRICNNHT